MPEAARFGRSTNSQFGNLKSNSAAKLWRKVAEKAKISDGSGGLFGAERRSRHDATQL